MNKMIGVWNFHWPPQIFLPPRNTHERGSRATALWWRMNKRFALPLGDEDERADDDRNSKFRGLRHSASILSPALTALCFMLWPLHRRRLGATSRHRTRVGGARPARFTSSTNSAALAHGLEVHCTCLGEKFLSWVLCKPDMTRKRICCFGFSDQAWLGRTGCGFEQGDCCVQHVHGSVPTHTHARSTRATGRRETYTSGDRPNKRRLFPH